MGYKKLLIRDRMITSLICRWYSLRNIIWSAFSKKLYCNKRVELIGLDMEIAIQNSIMLLLRKDQPENILLLWRSRTIHGAMTKRSWKNWFLIIITTYIWRLIRMLQPFYHIFALHENFHNLIRKLSPSQLPLMRFGLLCLTWIPIKVQVLMAFQ